jgi:hypothetical protein
MHPPWHKYAGPAKIRLNIRLEFPRNHSRPYVNTRHGWENRREICPYTGPFLLYSKGQILMEESEKTVFLKLH